MYFVSSWAMQLCAALGELEADCLAAVQAVLPAIIDDFVHANLDPVEVEIPLTMTIIIVP